MSASDEISPEFWADSNLRLFQELDRRPKRQGIVTTVRFTHQLESDEMPLTINALYEGIHQSEDKLWWLDATPLNTTIEDPDNPPSFIGGLVGNVSVGGHVLTWEDVGETPAEQPLTMPSERIKTSYWLGHVIGTVITTQPEANLLH